VAAAIKKGGNMKKHGYWESRFRLVVARLWVMQQKCKSEGRGPGVSERAKAKEYLGELCFLEPKVLAEVADSAKEGRGFRPDLKDNTFRQEWAKYRTYFAE
jgi:hypothetical protein